MIATLRRRRWSLAWLLVIVALGVLLAWLVSVPLLRDEPDGRSGAGVGRPPKRTGECSRQRCEITLRGMPGVAQGAT